MGEVRKYGTEVLIIGGGLGGAAAALTAARLGRRVVITEPTDWLGGQLTSQAVPPDEHPWIDTQYVSPSYRRLRNGIRAYYRRNYPLSPASAADPLLNPGLGFVSGLCHEPRVAASVLTEMLAPHLAAGMISVLYRHVPVSAVVDGDRVVSVTVADRDSGVERTFDAPYVIDATELGDLLPLTGAEHVIGAEGVDDTGEPHAPQRPDPTDQQPITWCFALEHRPGEHHVVDRPAGYERWLDAVAPFWPGSQLSWTDLDPVTLEPRSRPLFAGDPAEAGSVYADDLWHYRRILAARQFRTGEGLALITDVTVANWPQIDYWERPVLGADGVDPTALTGARELALSFLHWMQTEAPRHDGGTGYPGLRLRPDVTGTVDGLAKTAYVREARRIKAAFTVREQHVGVLARGGAAGSEPFADSVGLGCYRIDLHPTAAGRSYVDIDAYPFQIPLGALLPVRLDNLLPAAKNIGTTHLTNGCYRPHPVEWSIGEAVGALAAYCLGRGVPPRAIRADAGRLADFQQLLTGPLGLSLSWPDRIRRTARGQSRPVLRQH